MLSTTITAIVFTLSIPSLFAQHQFPLPTKAAAATFTPGVEFPYIGHEVADLDKSLRWFTNNHFQIVEGPTAWTVDEALNKLGNTPGAESRSAIVKIQSSGAIPFTLVLRQYRGIPQQDWSKRAPSEPSATSRNVLDARIFLEDLGVIPNTRVQDALSSLPVLDVSTRSITRPIRTARMEDLDGLGFDVYIASDILHVRASASPLSFTPKTATFQDINANYTAFKVNNLDAILAQAKEWGAETITEGGIMNYNNGRAVLLREPYANSYIVLWQPAS